MLISHVFFLIQQHSSNLSALFTLPSPCALSPGYQTTAEKISFFQLQTDVMEIIRQTPEHGKILSSQIRTYCNMKCSHC